jgi:hypothetical protein
MAFLNLLANTDSTATNYGSLFLPTCLVVVLIYFLAGFNQAPQDGKTPPSIPESFPGLGNGYSFIFQNMKFLDYVMYVAILTLKPTKLTMFKKEISGPEYSEIQDRAERILYHQ